MRRLAVVMIIGLLWPQVACTHAPTMEATSLEAIRLQLYDYLRGVTDPTALPKGREPLEHDVVQRLQRALAADDLEAVWRPLLPTHSAYFRLRQALRRYQEIAADGGWPLIGNGPTLRLGDRGQRVALLRDRLEITGDLQVRDATTPAFFDHALQHAVRAFQQRHGLQADGIVDAETRLALDVPAKHRVQQIAVNMARWRQLPHDLGDRYLYVNIPAFTLTVVEDDQTIMQMPVSSANPPGQRPSSAIRCGIS